MNYYNVTFPNGTLAVTHAVGKMSDGLTTVKTAGPNALNIYTPEARSILTASLHIFVKGDGMNYETEGRGMTSQELVISLGSPQMP